MLARCGDIVKGGGDLTFSCSELGGVSVGYGNQLIFCSFTGSIEGNAVVGTAGHGVAKVICGKPTGENRDLGQVAQQWKSRLLPAMQQAPR